MTHEKVAISSRPKVIEDLFNELIEHLKDDARDWRGEVVYNDPLMVNVTDKVIELRDLYGRVYA